jgi:hypothetical protein
MRPSLFVRILLGLAVPIVGALSSAEAKPRPPEPPPDAEFMTLRGTVKEFTTAPKGEVDGLVLTDGKWIHWPPHLQDRFKDLAAKGDRVRATGWWETGRRSETKLEVSTLTNLATNKTAENPDRPAPAAAAPSAGPRGGETETARGKVKDFTTAPKGEVDGAMLDDGTWLHWPPHMQDRFSAILERGDPVRATGRIETGRKGDTHFEVQSVTNLRTNASADNPDFANGPPPRRPGPGRIAPPPPPDREQRLRDLENQVEQLRREIERLRREK